MIAGAAKIATAAGGVYGLLLYGIGSTLTAVATYFYGSRAFLVPAAASVVIFLSYLPPLYPYSMGLIRFGLALDAVGVAILSSIAIRNYFHPVDVLTHFTAYFTALILTLNAALYFLVAVSAGFLAFHEYVAFLSLYVANYAVVGVLTALQAPLPFKVEINSTVSIWRGR